MNALTTEGITISVDTSYDARESRPSRDYYAFSYRITIKNERDEPVQLLSRHWFITDSKETVLNFASCWTD